MIFAVLAALIALLVLYACRQVTIGKQQLSKLKVSDFVLYYEDACFDFGQLEQSDEMKSATKWLYMISKDKPLSVGKRHKQQDVIFYVDFVYKGPSTYIYKDGSLCLIPSPSAFRGERFSPTWWYYKYSGGDLAFYTEASQQIADTVANWPQEWKLK